VRVLAISLKGRPQYQNYISDGYLEDLCLSSVLHDVGKVAISDAILLKPDKLTREEFTRIKDQPAWAATPCAKVDKELNARAS